MRGPHLGDTLGGDTVDYWAPLLQLLVTGLGWRSPALGLQRWMRGGGSTESPVLAVVDRWWGPYLRSYLASPTAATVDSAVRAWFHHHVPASASVRSPEPEPSEPDPRWQYLWTGGGDPMHLSYHFDLSADAAPFQLIVGPDAGRRAALITDGYRGWYSHLTHCGLARTAAGDSWQVDVVVKPLGWLGTYRVSRETGAWFSGRHRWHQLGW